MFLSFCFSDAETRYSTTEHEALAVVRCLAEVRWLVVGSKHLTFIDTDHEALKLILMRGSEGNARIARWQDRLGECNFIVRH